MSEYRLDRTAFKAQTAKEASNHTAYYKTLTWQERLKVANYLNRLPIIIRERPPKWIVQYLQKPE
jgi:hypothetical protein